MPETFDLDDALDQAFAEFTRDVGDHTCRPGAERAARAGRRRRTTKIVGGVCALVLLIGGGTALLHDRPQDRAIEPAEGPLGPHALTADVLDRATSGWASDWDEPDLQQLRGLGDDSAVGSKCGTALMTEVSYAAVRNGGTVFLSGPALAYAMGGVARSVAAARDAVPTGPVQGCGRLERSTPALGTELVTTQVTTRAGAAVVAMARWHDRVAVLTVTVPRSEVPADVEPALGKALLAAVREGTVATRLSPVFQQVFGVGQVSSSSGPPRTVRRSLKH